MRLLSWSYLAAVAIASSIPLSVSHELHLPYYPATHASQRSNTYLSLQWSVTDGCLYANHDQVFPPTTSMQIRAPEVQGESRVPLNQRELEFTYSLNARRLSSEEVGNTSKIVRIQVELQDLQGAPVTQDVVVLDLLAHPDGSQRITRLRIEPGMGHRMHGNRPWHMTFWQSQSSKSNPESVSPEGPASKTVPDRPAPATIDDTTEGTSVGFIFSPYWSPSTSYNSHRGHGHRRPPHPARPFMHIVRPVILPAVLGATAGLVACLVGFVIGHLCMSLAARLGLRRPGSSGPPATVDVEQGSLGEKLPIILEVCESEEDSD
ncbi:hypothetical protein PDE_08080 [Penicillium oxalicum 114-2]|uniref:Uncharacterized protein n=1 Tax=Penicillium oxalicum (strain 114-2 / CGMCC 5302) TaxID=933388 RepID=S8B2Q7_PENO1|nr:hypothetical protein PDE_08080 [Penicillium oxalicum 114-2]